MTTLTRASLIQGNALKLSKVRLFFFNALYLLAAVALAVPSQGEGAQMGFVAPWGAPTLAQVFL